MNYNQKIAGQLNVRPDQVAATIALLDEGNTIPFIARYRKEMTFNLDEFQIRQIQETVTKFRALDERRTTILTAIEEQGKLTPALKKDIEAAESMTVLEDLYLPYKQKRKTRASAARERGLQPLADLILAQPRQGDAPLTAAKKFVTADVPTVDDALAGACDIVAETVSDNASVRGRLREKALQWATIASTRIPDSTDEKRVYEMYYQFSLAVKHLKPYQVLAINRGETEKVLRVGIEVQERDWQDIVYATYRADRGSAWAAQLHEAIQDAMKRLLLPAIERDVRRTLTESAELHAIDVFAENLRNLLGQPPITGHVVLGLDPGFRTGCKVAVVDDSGKVLATGVIYPHEPQKQWRESLAELAKLITKYKINLIAIGNGTASRETEMLAAEITRAMQGVKYVIVNEAGASVYSASDLARAEMPDLDVSLRGAVSIARRVQDPLAELVKIDPKSIGVGMYQHDVDQKQLSGALDAVVESVVNQVGVDVNTASPALLQYVAGIGNKLAQNLVSYRNDNGMFKTRAALKKVSGMGAKAFEQSAGFLRIREGSNPLDASAIHPESYDVAKAVLERAGVTIKDAGGKRELALNELRRQTPPEKLAAELDAGIHTLTDIFEQLVRPGRDPREDLPLPVLRSDVLSMEDLKEGMMLSGTVRNVVDFGAFVDIGVKQDGLLHKSQFPRGKNIGVGDVIKVKILNVDKERGRIGLGWV